MTECLERAEREPFHTGTEAPIAAYVGGFGLLVRIAEDGKVLFGIERVRPGGRWIFLKPLGDTDRRQC